MDTPYAKWTSFTIFGIRNSGFRFQILKKSVVKLEIVAFRKFTRKKAKIALFALKNLWEFNTCICKTLHCITLLTLCHRFPNKNMNAFRPKKWRFSILHKFSIWLSWNSVNYYAIIKISQFNICFYFFARKSKFVWVFRKDNWKHQSEPVIWK